MATLVAGAPLLAGGPPGWVIYGALALITVGALGAGVLMSANNDANDVGGSSAAEPCASCQDAAVDEIEQEADVKQQTKGKTKHGEKSGGTGEANKDFDKINPSNVKPIDTTYGPGRTGTLADGRNVTVRPGSSDGRPTLEIRNPSNGRGSEIRYNP